ncbi:MULTISPECIES: asparagine synthase (glutamine-hydrolyzing) [Pseudomonas]|uniref:asparagine synthase (glutamine-hydrolyzing) n=1 Tax=Pseudomonas TaxID=286 RepID=UPI001C656B9D|nr:MULTISPECIES: asparagine synthase (glutamine-hydrolyzing) [unclassified Pseudomonas]MBW8126356.1 asparagine synthase (glutamine-hydrolyzing) [Pseudomonas sp. LAP_36]MBW8136029.1 asparagine synthase (glutamine-hydrolyzing) [Pseudomonas sp. PAMC 26818]
MCGITGGFWRVTPPGLDQRVNAALAAMRLRGPDHQGFDRRPVGEGAVVLGHTRLAIIDLSASGQQPMYTADQRFGLVFNGEIYNYIELRAELESFGAKFRTRSDTEVLLAAWSHWGKAALPRLKGMFAFVVFDRQEGSLTCVRDAFGIKPFFYALEDGAFIFGSELPALRALKTQRSTLNWQRAYDYLVHGEYDFGQESFIDGVVSLLPGQLVTVNLAALKVSSPETWWKPSILKTQSMSFSSASDQLREMFLDNVRLHLRSDVPVGAALSGGVDSSAIVCAMRHLEPDSDINTFSYIARGSGVSEESWVDKVNTHVGAKAHKVIVSGEELAADLEDLITAQGEPFGSTSIYAQYRVFKKAREQGVTVTLEGQGADENQGGYNGYVGQRIRSLLDDGQLREAWSFLGQWSKWPGRSRVEGLKRIVGEYSEGGLHDLLRGLNGMDNCPAWIRPGPLRESGVHLGFPKHAPSQQIPGRRMMSTLASSLNTRGLLGLLRHGDRNSMRFSVESRVPFLTTDLADFMLSLPEAYLVSPAGETKHLLRSALRGIVPAEVLERRDKIGFATPEQQWLMGMADVLRPWLKEDLGLPFLDQAKLLEHFDAVVSGRRPYTWQVWRWVNFARWYGSLR